MDSRVVGPGGGWVGALGGSGVGGLRVGWGGLSRGLGAIR